jgi:tight adherence protein B
MRCDATPDGLVRVLSALLCTLLGLLVLVPTPHAVARDHEGVSIERVETGSFPTVEVLVGAPVPPGGSPGEDSFHLSEGGEARDVTVEQLSTADLEVVLLIDTSGSMGGAPITAARQAASTFVSGLPQDVRVAVMTFDSEVRVVSGSDASREEQLAAIDTIEAGGRTSLYDSVLAGLDSLSPASPDGGGRAIILLSDGEDNESAATLQDAAERLAEADVDFKAVAYGTAWSDIEGLDTLAEAADGTITDETDPEGLVGLYEQFASTLINRYALRYESGSGGATDLAVRFNHGEVQTSGSREVILPTPTSSEEAPPEADLDAPVPTTRVEVTGLSRAALALGASLWFVALAAVALIVLWPGRVRAQLVGIARRRTPHRGLTDLASRASLIAEEGLERRGYRRGLSAALERAGIDLRPGEFVVLAASAGVGGFALGFVLHGVLIGLLLALVSGFGARLVVPVLADRRQAKFADQLGDTLQLLSGSLRAGYGLMQAVDSVAREADAPASEEFGRLVVETRLGRDMTDALAAMADRMESPDFEWVTQAMEIHREVGGDLAEVLDTVGETIRERNKLRRQVKALTAEGRMSAWVLLALPFGVAILMYFLNRPYISELWSNGLLGYLLLGTAGVMMTAGMFWMTKLVKIDL